MVNSMQITANDFIKSPALYLDKVDDSTITIIKDGKIVALLTKPSDTPMTDSLLGLLKDTGIKGKDDIKALKVEL